MTDDAFLTAGEFEALSEDQRDRYALAVADGMGEDVLNATALAYTEHYLDVAEWVLPDEDYDKLVRMRLWSAYWDHAEEIKATLEKILETSGLNEAERAQASRNLETVSRVLEHKQDLQWLGVREQPSDNNDTTEKPE